MSAKPTVPIRVAVKIRPVLASEAVDHRQCCITVVGSDQVVLGRDRQFRFDHVFDSTVSQLELYQTCLLPCVAACLDGYNTTVFAYGQTSSGKSYTMGSEGVGGGGWEGREEGDGAGIIPRALEDIFQQIQKRKSTETGEAVQWRVGVSYIEIYKEELRDLLDCGVCSQHLIIRDNEQGHTIVVGAREERVESSEEALNLLFAGNTSRVTEATEMNKRSSRSHAIFTIFVERRWIGKQELNSGLHHSLQDNYTCAKFHFVDLAGSERAGRTGNRGDRFKESVHINSGLLALGNVISVLGEQKRSSHVPYRDSKITRLLKDSLGGNSRTIMIACLNPLAENFAESLNTLKFAKRARNIRNHPVINRDPQTARLHEMEGEIRSLRAELQRAQSAHSKPHLPSPAMSSTIAEPLPLAKQNVMAAITVTQLRLELERCQTDLETDEVLYAEKVEELNEVQCRHDDAVREIKRLKGLWEAGQRAEDMLRREVERLGKRVRELEVERVRELDVKQSTEEEGLSQENGKQRVERDGDRGQSEVKFGQAKCQSSQESSVLHGELLMTEKIGEKRAGDFSSCVQLLKRKVRTDREEDLSDEAVLQSMRSLTSLLAQHQPTSTAESPASSSEPRDGNTPREREREKEGEREGEKKRSLETSSYEPALSQETERGREEEGEEELHLLNQSVILSRQQLNETHHKLLDAHNELKDLSIKIKLKEEWVQELVKKNMMGKQLNQMYISQIQSLEQEAAKAQLELRKALQTQQHKQQESCRAQELEQQRKLAEAEKKLVAVQNKHRATQRAMQWGERSGRRVEELEATLERLRSRQETMRRRLKKHAEMKTKLEGDVQTYQQKVQQLQSHSDCQKKVLRVKTQEAAVAQRKLRQMNSHSNTDIAAKAPEGGERQWLDGEVERILQQKQTLQMLEKELAERERLVRERELVATQRAALETKQLHCNQAVARDLTRLSVQIQSLDSSIRASESGTEQGGGDSGRHKQEVSIAKFKGERDRLIGQRSELQGRAHNTSLLPVEDEKQLVELSEHIEVLEAAIEFKNEAIASRQIHASTSESTQNEMWQKLQQMTQAQVSTLLVSYVGKVVDLRVISERRERERKRMAAECAEKQQTVLNLQRSLKQAQHEVERRLLSQEKEHQQQLQVLMQQLAMPVSHPPTSHIHTGTSTSTTSTSTTPTNHTSISATFTSQPSHQVQLLQTKVKTLERELYYYKKTSRDLKKRLQVVKVGSSSGAVRGSSRRHTSTATASDSDTLREHTSHTSQAATTKSDCLQDIPLVTQVHVCLGNSKNSTGPEREGKVRSDTKGMLSDSLDVGPLGENSKPVSVSLVAGEDVGSSETENGRCTPTEEESVGDRTEQSWVPTEVVLKSKKQLRQLSASEIAERLNKDKADPSPEL